MFLFLFLSLFVCLFVDIQAAVLSLAKENYDLLIICFIGIVEKLLLQGVYVGDAMLRAVDIGLPETVQKIGEFAETMPVRFI